MIYVGLYFMDIHASAYGNGIIHLYRNLNYHISLTKINHNYFLYGDLGYIMPQEYYNKLFIEDIIGYKNSVYELKIYVSTNNMIKSLSFYNETMVIDKTPIIKEESNIPDDIINFKSIPFIQYYWKVFFMIGILISIILFINSLYKLIIKIYKHNISNNNGNV